MKKVKHDVKLERSVKIILGILAVGILLNAFSTPIAMELFGVKEVLAESQDISGHLYVSCSGCS